MAWDRSRAFAVTGRRLKTGINVNCIWSLSPYSAVNSPSGL
jgi:hypothetical protein